MQSFLKWNTVKVRGTCSILFEFFLQEWSRSCHRPFSFGTGPCPSHTPQSPQHIHSRAGGLRAPGTSTGWGLGWTEGSRVGAAALPRLERFLWHTSRDRKVHNGSSLTRTVRVEAAQQPQHPLLATAGEETKSARDLIYSLLQHSVFHKEDCNEPINK